MQCGEYLSTRGQLSKGCYIPALDRERKKSQKDSRSHYLLILPAPLQPSGLKHNVPEECRNCQEYCAWNGPIHGFITQ